MCLKFEEKVIVMFVHYTLISLKLVEVIVSRLASEDYVHVSV